VSADGLKYQDERKLPAYYNEDIIPDPETGLNLPVRILDYFYFCDAVQFVPLEHLGTLRATTSLSRGISTSHHPSDTGQ
jgi:hypothetical protein